MTGGGTIAASLVIALWLMLLTVTSLISMTNITDSHINKVKQTESQKKCHRYYKLIATN